VYDRCTTAASIPLRRVAKPPLLPGNAADRPHRLSPAQDGTPIGNSGQVGSSAAGGALSDTTSANPSGARVSQLANTRTTRQRGVETRFRSRACLRSMKSWLPRSPKLASTCRAAHSPELVRGSRVSSWTTCRPQLVRTRVNPPRWWRLTVIGTPAPAWRLSISNTVSLGAP